MKSSSASSNYPWWAPRFWHGMRFSDWMRFVARHRFRIHPSRWGLATTVTGMSLFNSAMARGNRWRFQRQLRDTPLVDDPVFIVGHWRSGTTYLHELLSCDARFATPTTYQCFAANHFLFTEGWIPRLLWFLMPSQRPMDNVRTSWNAPQEDEFALCSLGMASPYLRIAFPNDAHNYLEYLDLESIPSSERDRWFDQLHHFLVSLTVAHRKRLILKSPTHTARIGWLAQRYPRARFLHIARHPVSIYLSTMNLWRVLDDAQGLQKPHLKYLKDYVLTAFERMYQAYEQQRAQLAKDQLAEIRYEDLVADPAAILRSSYEQLQLGNFDAVEEPLKAMTQSNRAYQTNRFEIDEATRDEIMSRWSHYATRFGYQ